MKLNKSHPLYRLYGTLIRHTLDVMLLPTAQGKIKNTILYERLENLVKDFLFM